MTLGREQLEALRCYDTPTLANAIEAFGLRPFTDGFTSPHIRCVFPDLPRMVGYAVTATMSARPVVDPDVQSRGAAALYEHAGTQPEPRIVVVQDTDAPESCGALWGEVHSTIFTALGCEGVVTDGVVRDLPEVKAIGFRYFAGGIGVSHGYNTVRDVGCEVLVGGLTVRPGDLLHADMHGVLAIPSEIAGQLPDAADAIIAREQQLLTWVRSAEFDPTQLLERRAKH